MWKPSAWIALIYAAVTAIWILFSDTLLARLVSDPERLTRLQTAKGWVFVAVSSLGLLLLIRRTLVAMEGSTREQARSDELLGRIFETSPLGIVLIDDQSRYVRCNQAFADLLGYPRDQVVGMHNHEVTHPEDRELTDDLFAKIAGSGGHMAIEKRYLRSDGTVRWAHLTAAQLMDDEESYGVGIVKDITVRKEREERLDRTLQALRASANENARLMAALLRAEEAERQRIAGDIHDDTLQVLTSVLLELDLATTEEGRDRARFLIGEASSRLRRATKGLRDLVFELRPTLLETEGLMPAVRLLLEEAATRANFEWALEGDVRGEFSTETQVLAYRVAREALLNSAKHSGASGISVRVEDDGDGLRVCVHDNGTGFDPRLIPDPGRKSMGLGLMRERVEVFGGSFQLTSHAGMGTTVDLWLPRHPAVRAPSGQMTLEDAADGDPR